MFWQAFLRWLRQPFPFSNNWSGAFAAAIITGLFVTLFLFVFQPFGATVPPGQELKYLVICLEFGLITSAITLITNGLTRFFPTAFDEEYWVVWKEIVFNLIFISGIGFGNLLLAHFQWHIPLNGRTFWSWQGITFAVGFFPTIVGALIGQMKLSKRYTAEAAQLSLKPHSGHDEPAWVVLEGENLNETLQLHPSQIAYIAAADNYIRVFYLDNGQVKNQMLRATLKKMEDALAAYPYLFRCHRTYLVNMDLVIKVSGNAQGYRLHLDGLDTTIPVSRNLNTTIQSRL